jgi:hypothetical protein
MEHGMIHLWRNDKTFYYALLEQTGFLFFASVSHMDDRMSHRELEILAHVRIEAHYVYILNSLAFPSLIV